jgi:hypothetical protein
VGSATGCVGERGSGWIKCSVKLKQTLCHSCYVMLVHDFIADIAGVLGRH